MFKDFLNSKLTGGAVAGNKTGLMNMPKSQAHVDNGGFVEFGYGQVEPNHLSAQRNGQIYAQLPAAPSIEILEQGQFVKYDYAANGNGIGEVNFTGAGEWMLVYNEIKLYRDHLDGTKQWDCEFAMIKDDYQARIYSPYDYEVPEEMYHNGLYLNGKDEFGATSKTLKRYFTAEHPTKNENGVVYFKSIDIDGVRCEITPTIAPNKDTGLLEVTKAVFTYKGKQYEIDPKSGDTKEPIPVTYAFDDVTLNTVDPYEPNFTNDPWGRLGLYREKKIVSYRISYRLPIKESDKVTVRIAVGENSVTECFFGSDGTLKTIVFFEFDRTFLPEEKQGKEEIICMAEYIKG